MKLRLILLSLLLIQQLRHRRRKKLLKANVASAQKKVDEETSNFDKAKGDLDQAKHDAVKSDTDYKTQSDKVDELKKTTDQKNADLTDAKSKVRMRKTWQMKQKIQLRYKPANDAVAKQEDTVANANKAKDDADKAGIG